MRSRCIRAILTGAAFLSIWLACAPRICQAAAPFSSPGQQVSEALAIKNMAAQGIIRPVAAEHASDGVMTRGEFAASLQRLFNLPVPESPVNFSDVAPGAAQYSAIQAAAPYLGRQMRCMNCSLGQTFGPGQPVTHLEAAIALTSILLARQKLVLVSAEEADDALSQVPDAARIKGPLRLYLATAMRRQIIGPIPADSPAQRDALTRAGTAVLLDATQKRFALPRVHP